MFIKRIRIALVVIGIVLAWGPGTVRAGEVSEEEAAAAYRAWDPEFKAEAAKLRQETYETIGEWKVHWADIENERARETAWGLKYNTEWERVNKEVEYLDAHWTKELEQSARYKKCIVDINKLKIARAAEVIRQRAWLTDNINNAAVLDRQTEDIKTRLTELNNEWDYYFGEWRGEQDRS